MVQDLNQSYRLLGVDELASPAEVKRAYRRLALTLHPDRNPKRSDAAERFEELKRAYAAVLAMAEFRALIRPDDKSEPAPHRLDWRLRDIETDGLDVVYRLDVDLADGGGLAALPHRHDQTCPACQGGGSVERWSWSRLSYLVKPCRKCRGRGRLERVKTLNVRLPAWLKAGSRLRLAGRGLLEAATGLRGDLLLEITSTELHAETAA